MSNIIRKWIFLLLLSLIWGSSFILIKKGLIGLTPLQLGSYRIVISSIIIFLFGFNSLKGLNKKKWKWLAISGFLGSFFPSFLFCFLFVLFRCLWAQTSEFETAAELGAVAELELALPRYMQDVCANANINAISGQPVLNQLCLCREISLDIRRRQLQNG